MSKRLKKIITVTALTVGVIVVAAVMGGICWLIVQFNKPEPAPRRVAIVTKHGDKLIAEYQQKILLTKICDTTRIYCGKCNRLLAELATEHCQTVTASSLKCIYRDAALTAYELVPPDVDFAGCVIWISTDHTTCGGNAFSPFYSAGLLDRIKAGDDRLFRRFAPLARALVQTHKHQYFPEFYEILLAHGDPQTIATVQRYAKGKFNAAERQANATAGQEEEIQRIAKTLLD